MGFFTRKRNWLISILLLAALAVIASYFHLRSREKTPVQKGREVAEKYGCFACHGFEGSKGIHNPGYNFGDVPSWQGGTAMMYIKNDEEIREWILFGKPKRKEKRSDGLIKMPAFEGIISKSELEDLVIYLKAVMKIIEIKDSAALEGFNIAEKTGCFGCHGPYGMGGMNNAFALKKYIPGWDGKDFSELVKNDEELKQWIEEGEIERLSKNPAAKYFTERQIVKMPGYQEILSQKETNAIMDYIHWLRKNNF